MVPLLGRVHAPAALLRANRLADRRPLAQAIHRARATQSTFIPTVGLPSDPTTSPFRPAAPSAEFGHRLQSEEEARGQDQGESRPPVVTDVLDRRPPLPSAASVRPSPAASSLSREAAPADIRHSRWDVVVIGEGISGHLTALAIAADPATQHMRILLTDGIASFHSPIMTPAHSYRVLTPATAAFLQRIHCWPAIQRAAGCVTPFQRVVLSDAGTPGEQVVWTGAETLRPSEWQTSSEHESLGWIVDESVLWETLRMHVKTIPSIEAVDSFVQKVERIEPGEPALGGVGWPRVVFSTGRTVSARLLIGADGPASIVKEFAQIDTVGTDLPKRVLEETMELEGSADAPSQPHTSTVYHRFLANGELLSLLPLSQRDRVRIRWTMPTKKARVFERLEAQTLAQRVNAAMEEEDTSQQRKSWLEGLLPVQQLTRSITRCLTPPSAQSPPAHPAPRVSALRSADSALRRTQSVPVECVTSFVAGRCALVGTAAYRLPTSAIGPTTDDFSFGDAASLARCLSDATQSGEEIGSRNVLSRYDRERREAIAQAVLHSEATASLFAQQAALLRPIRSAIVHAFAAVPGLKQYAAKIAMGL